MKKCSKCHNYKSTDEYFIKSKSTGKLHAQCKQCHKLQRKLTYKKHYTRYRDQYLERAKVQRNKVRKQFQDKMTELMSDKFCAVCGETDFRVLELDHIDPSVKLFNISQAARLGYTWSQVISESEK